MNSKTTQRIENKITDIYENYVVEESNIVREDYKNYSDNLMKYLLDLLEYDLKMSGILEKFNDEYKQQTLKLPKKYSSEYPIVKYVTKKQRKINEENKKVEEKNKQVKDEWDSHEITDEEWEELLK